jgi:CHAT domain-containing protein
MFSDSVSSLKKNRILTRSLLSSNRLLAALALLLLGLGLGIWRVFFYPSDVERGIEALARAYDNRRPVQSRVSAFDYAPWVSGRVDEVIAEEENLSRAEMLLYDAVTERPGHETYHAFGLLYLARGKFDLAISEFEQAMKADEKNAKLYSDLGAALLEKGNLDRSENKLDKASEEYARSLDYLNKAIELDSSLREPLFNRALLYQEKALWSDAEKDWGRYLEKDPNSPWADEARRRLEELDSIKKNHSKSREQIFQEFLASFRAGDDAASWKTLSQNREAITGRLIPWQLLGAYLDKTAGRGADRDDLNIRALAHAGRLEAQKTGDRYVSDLAHFYSSASAGQLALLSRAHELMNQGHGLCRQARYESAANCYSGARELFDKAGDRPEAWFADYWISYCHLQAPDNEKARSMHERLARVFESQNYYWLLAVTLNGMANALFNTSEYTKAIEFNKRSLEISERLEDCYGMQKSLTQLANEYKALGNYRQSLIYLHRCLDLAGTAWPGARQMWRNYETAAQVFNGLGWFATAADYESEALRLALEEIKDPAYIYLPYLHLGIINGERKNLQEGIRLAELGYKTIEEFMSGSTRVRNLAYSSLVLGHLNRLAGSFETARAYYDSAIQSYDTLKYPAHIYAAHKGRLLCYIGQNDDSKAKRELDRVLELFDENRAKISDENNRNAFLETEQSIYDVAIEFAYSRMRDRQKALEYSEQSRARALLDLIKTEARVNERGDDLDLLLDSASRPLTFAEIRERMPEGIQVLQYAVLDDRLLIWQFTKRDLDIKEVSITPSELNEKVESFRSLLSVLSDAGQREAREEAKALYDMLIAPVEARLDPHKQLCLVPDKKLYRLPFAALVSPRDEYLMNRYLTLCAPSTSILVIRSETGRQREAAKGEAILSVGNPSFDKETFRSLDDIKSSAEEAEDLARYYASSNVVSGTGATERLVKSGIKSYEVVHLASHYIVDEQSPMLSKLLLAKGPAGSGRAEDGILQAHEVYATRLSRTRLVVLSACETGVERYYEGEGMVGLARAFIAAGAPLVVASMWPVDSDATKELMVRFHRYRKLEHSSTVEALRRAQSDMQTGPNLLYRQPHYWASFVLFGGYAEF